MLLLTRHCRTATAPRRRHRRSHARRRPIPEALADADIVIVAAALTSRTRTLLGQREPSVSGPTQSWSTSRAENSSTPTHWYQRSRPGSSPASDWTSPIRSRSPRPSSVEASTGTDHPAYGRHHGHAPSPVRRTGDRERTEVRSSPPADWGGGHSSRLLNILVRPRPDGLAGVNCRLLQGSCPLWRGGTSGSDRRSLPRPGRQQFPEVPSALSAGHLLPRGSWLHSVRAHVVHERGGRRSELTATTHRNDVQVAFRNDALNLGACSSRQWSHAAGSTA